MPRPAAPKADEGRLVPRAVVLSGAWPRSTPYSYGAPSGMRGRIVSEHGMVAAVNIIEGTSCH
ncbi:MAG: hypothetical protein ACR2JT_04640 [Nocardioidaceae bacterium]